MRALSTPLADGEVLVWVARPPALADATLALCAELLSSDERERVARFRFRRHQREATVSRALVRTTLARYVDLPPAAFAYRLGPHGRAVSFMEDIGVDTEPLSRGDEILTVAETVFSQPELDALDALPLDARRDRAVSLWTCKEAYIKARGLGLSASLRHVVVDFPACAAPRLRFLCGYDEPEAWTLGTQDVAGFRIAVAVRASVATAAGSLELIVREADWQAPAPARTRCTA